MKIRDKIEHERHVKIMVEQCNGINPPYEVFYIESIA